LYRAQVRQTLEYEADNRVEAAMNDLRAQAGIRRRKDGSPSSSRPRSHVPVKYWATVYEEPVAQYGNLRQRLEAYKSRLRYLQSRGLYDGPTELTVVNEETDATDRTDEG